MLRLTKAAEEALEDLAQAEEDWLLFLGLVGDNRLSSGARELFRQLLTEADKRYYNAEALIK